MLHTPANDTAKRASDKKSSGCARVAKKNQREFSAAAQHYSPDRLRARISANQDEQRRQSFAKAQATFGNQAVLRMLHGSNASRPETGHDCACGGKCGSCAGKNTSLHAAQPKHVESTANQPLADVEIQVIRHPVPSTLMAALSAADEAIEGGGEDIVTAQDAGAPAPGPSAPKPAPKPAAPTCTFSITYANQSTAACDGGRCGASIVFDITNVTATGSGCPKTLNGLRLTEVVTNDHGCSPANVQGGAGCPIGAGGAISNCTDTYSVCLGSTSQSKIPAS